MRWRRKGLLWRPTTRSPRGWRRSTGPPTRQAVVENGHSAVQAVQAVQLSSENSASRDRRRRDAEFRAGVVAKLALGLVRRLFQVRIHGCWLFSWDVLG